MHNIFRCKISPTGELQEVTAQLADLLGYSGFELQQLTADDLFIADDKIAFSKKCQYVLDSASPEFYDTFKGKTRNGDNFSVLIHGVLVRDKYGKPNYFTCTIYDYGQVEKTREKLSVTEQQFNSLFYDNPKAVYSINKNGEFERANKIFFEVSGYSQEDIIGKSFLNFLVDTEKERIQLAFLDALSGNSGTYKIKVKSKDGKILFLHVYNFPRYQDEKVVGIYGFLDDVTEPTESISRWKSLVEQNPEPVQIIQDGKIVYINQIGAEYYGTKNPDELIGFPLKKFSHPDSHELFDNRYKKLSEGQEIDPAVHKMITLNGNEKYIRTHSKPIRYQGRPAIQTVFYDITDHKKAEKEFGKSIKQKEILVKEIHHRVKNNLSVISSLLELQIINSGEEHVINALRDSQYRINAIAEIHDKLYQSESLTDICLGAHIKSLVDSIHQMHMHKDQDIRIEYEYDEIGLGIIQSVPCSLIVNEVVVNCFKHAFTNRKEGKICIRLKMNNQQLSITIKDNGAGLPDEISSNAKRSLGVTLINSLSEHLNGKATLENNPDGTGTCFKLTFTPLPFN